MSGWAGWVLAALLWVGGAYHRRWDLDNLQARNPAVYDTIRPATRRWIIYGWPIKMVQEFIHFDVLRLP